MVNPPKTLKTKHSNEATDAPFRRVKLADVEPPSQQDSIPGSHYSLVCLVCDQAHLPGQCRLKLAGTEHCGLCGLAHYGSQRTCPHFRSEMQVNRMLEALKDSKEDPALKQQARSYIYGIKGDLARRRKIQESRRLQQTQASEQAHFRANPTHTGFGSSPDELQGPPTIDLTNNADPVRPSASASYGYSSFGYQFAH